MILVLLSPTATGAMLSPAACRSPGHLPRLLVHEDLDIGLTVATLPVMVLATGIGVDYAFYIYNRLLIHLSATSR